MCEERPLPSCLQIISKGQRGTSGRGAPLGRGGWDLPGSSVPRSSRRKPLDSQFSTEWAIRGILYWYWSRGDGNTRAHLSYSPQRLTLDTPTHFTRTKSKQARSVWLLQWKSGERWSGKEAGDLRGQGSSQTPTGTTCYRSTGTTCYRSTWTRIPSGRSTTGAKPRTALSRTFHRSV